MAFRRLSALLIVSAATGCDNVEWGGIDVRLQPPPPALVGAPPDTATEAVPVAEELPRAPYLYMGQRDSSGVRLVPVGAIMRDSLIAFPSESVSPGYRNRFVRELLPQGTELVLFAEGVRVGSFPSTSVSTDDSFCVPRPVVRGIAELIPEALEVERFLAVPRQHVDSGGWGSLAPQETDRDQRDASTRLAADVLTQVGAEFPGDILNSRWDLQPFLPGGEGPSSFAATYLVRDRMLIERPPPSAYSLFMLAGLVEGTYQPVYIWYREAAREGKGAPRFFEQFDWDGDGQAEVLLEVLGEAHRWTAALDYKDGQWTRVHQDPCGAAAPPVGAPS